GVKQTRELRNNLGFVFEPRSRRSAVGWLFQPLPFLSRIDGVARHEFHELTRILLRERSFGQVTDCSLNGDSFVVSQRVDHGYKFVSIREIRVELSELSRPSFAASESSPCNLCN